MGEEKEAYTAELEVEAENAKDLERELSACPYGQQIMDLLKRAEFIPEVKVETSEEMKAEAEKESEELLKREEELREEGRKEIREKYLAYLKKKRGEEPEEVKAEVEDNQSDHEKDERDYHGIMPFGSGNL